MWDFLLKTIFVFRRISTIKGELIPYLVKKQFSITSKQICKADGIEVDDTPNPKMNNQNGETVVKSKKYINDLITQPNDLIKLKIKSYLN